ncbi:HipA domain-containing protein [Cereibacter sphaeroides]|uniref:type II toxin-antitoxin system HipA family toxin n=1 Tax=Cereibacter sphaeroides TaxID=1063 RepID=UPI001F35E2E7|nr:HipA domain-containing protein [Cereibacter sphaeroides]MCE6959353.1 HipA domain-containing protein [Cereibacter sphaeroides]MCE6972945.1 HipA domain-containing protein [Cereibacter sphaeroides]
MDVTAIVFIEREGRQVPAGRIRIVEDGRFSRSEFAYGRRYLERPDAVALDPVQLPLVPEVLVAPDDHALFNGIRDASPDAWGRRLIDRFMLRAHGRPAGEAEFLLVSQSGHRVGALRFGADPSGPGRVLDVDLEVGEICLGDLESFQGLVDALERGDPVPSRLADFVAPGSDLGGARPKGTVAIDGFPWLVKFGLDRDRYATAPVEAACLDLCEMAGLPVCERRLMTVAGRPALMLRRFDRETAEDGALRRRHMISSLTLLGGHESDRGMSGYADIHDGLRRYGTGDHGEQIFRRMVMNVLCGNTDDHYRNHAFLLQDNGYYAPSPVFDVTPTLQLGSTRHLFLHLGKAGAGREATLEAAVRGGESLGLQRDQAIAIANGLSELVAANWRATMQARGVSAEDIGMIAGAFSHAGRQVEAEAVPEP